MSDLCIKFNAKQIEKAFERLEAKAPYIVADALNETAKSARDEVKAQLPRIFDRPTKFTSSVFVRFAKSTNLVSEVFFRDEAAKGTPPAKYLSATG